MSAQVGHFVQQVLMKMMSAQPCHFTQQSLIESMSAQVGHFALQSLSETTYATPCQPSQQSNFYFQTQMEDSNQKVK
jgi:hypothetical protein